MYSYVFIPILYLMDRLLLWVIGMYLFNKNRRKISQIINAWAVVVNKFWPIFVRIF